MRIGGIGGATSSLDMTRFTAETSSRTEEEAEQSSPLERPEDPAVAREREKVEEDRRAVQQDRESRMQAIRDYIETYGAPEEKDQDQAEELFWDRLQKQDDKRKQGMPALANQTWGVTIQDPNDEGKIHVYTVKTDREGKAKITRNMQFDSGDGEDRSQLTPERARANKAYAKAMVGDKAGDEDKDKRDSTKV